jgi:F-type H+-transporting ATPase subunit epsilon
VPIPLRVVSVEESLFEGEADFIVATGSDGELGILPNHAPLLTTLAPGPLMIRHSGSEDVLFVGGGFMEVLPDRVTVLADVAERAEDISEEAAEEARKRAQDALAGDLSPLEQAQMTGVLEMAEARLRLSRVRRGRG